MACTRGFMLTIHAVSLDLVDSCLQRSVTSAGFQFSLPAHHFFGIATDGTFNVSSGPVTDDIGCRSSGQIKSRSSRDPLLHTCMRPQPFLCDHTGCYTCIRGKAVAVCERQSAQLDSGVLEIWPKMSIAAKHRRLEG